MERFVEKYRIDPESGCWIWTAALDRRGYGVFAMDPSKNKVMRAHRAAWELYVGAIPEDRDLDHLCRVPACVSPDHLEPVPHAVNMRRAADSRTHCKQGHEFTPENTYVKLLTETRRVRKCRTCEAERMRAWYQANRKKA